MIEFGESINRGLIGSKGSKSSRSSKSSKSLMCLAIPGEIIKIEGRKATVKYPGESRFAMVAEVEVVPGDMVMVQMGVIMKKLSSEEARLSKEAWEEVEKKQGSSK